MFAVITGDIVQSQQTDVELWMHPLKKILSQYGSTPKDWEIYRGDSFQIITSPEQALLLGLIIKSSLKSNNINVRMAIGVGDINYRTDKITESNGSAFVNSGTSFDRLKKHYFSIKTPWEHYNTIVNTMLDLASITMDKWTAKTAKVICFKFQNPTMNQIDIAENFDKKGQGNISEALKRGGYDQLNQFLNYYRQSILELC
ncbi:transcriptional regulator [Flavobacterium algicola]|uniref:transcriptional regulator n=1 Tax=Flavobacterium algicola TaxID=556529 RepID=UPI001EFCA91C|nr:transcriptional regulator [Flavobacterium algicola]MCG9792681.1 transcriptional regulator [Flavobacterium algicola]